MKELFDNIKEYGTLIAIVFGVVFSIAKLKRMISDMHEKSLRKIIGEDIKNGIQPLSDKLDDVVHCFEERFNKLELKDKDFITETHADIKFVSKEVCNEKHKLNTESERIIR